MIERDAVRVRAASAAHVARIATLLTETRLIQWTVRVTTTAGETLFLDANMAKLTVLVVGALVPLNALVEQTDLSLGALVVGRTVGILAHLHQTPNGRIAAISVGARAHWFMALRMAQCIVATHVGELARIDTLQGDATLARRTLAIGATSSLTLVVLANVPGGRTVQVDDALHGLALDARIARVLGQARTEWLMIAGHTLGARSTSGWILAHVHALAIDARIGGWTVGVRPTSGHAQASLTDGARWASIVVGADGATQSLHTLLIVVALLILTALHSTVGPLVAHLVALGAIVLRLTGDHFPLTFNVRIPHRTSLASAHSLMIVHRAQ